MPTESRPRISLCRTKLHRPPLTRRHIARTRLNHRLDEDVSGSFVLLSSPAGTGKSTLVSQWVEAQSRPCAWLSLDPDDSDLTVFITYLVAAIRQAMPSSMPRTDALLEARMLAPVAVVAVHLSNDLDALEGPLAIVLDDVHRLEATSDVYEVLQLLLARPRQAVRLVLVTRRDPALGLAKLRADGRIVELRLKDLRFSRGEALELINASGLSISPHVRRQLVSVTEGWVAGLNLALMTAGRLTDPNAVLSRLGGGLPDIQDYLIGEVLAQQPPELREMMLRAAVLDSFCADVLDALWQNASPGTISGREFVEHLRRDNAFVIPLDHDDRWLRYHHLFQELLLAKLTDEVGKPEVARLRMRACDWFLEQGYIDVAIGQALSARDAQAAAAIVEQHRHREIDADRWHVLANWLSKLPPEVRGNHPGMFVADAWVAAFRMDYVRSAWLLETWQTRFASTDHGDAPWDYEMELLSANLRCWSGEAKQALCLLDRVDTRIPEFRSLLRGEAYLIRAVARSMLGQGKSVVDDAAALLKVCRTDALFTTRVLAAQIYCKHFAAVAPTTIPDAQQMGEVAARQRFRNSAAWGHYFEGYARLQAGELEAATQAFEQAATGRYFLELPAAIDALCGLALAYQLRGCSGPAIEALEELRQLGSDTGDFQAQERFRSMAARIDLLAGRLPDALEWARTAVPSVSPDVLSLWLEVPALTQARVWTTSESGACVASAVQILEQAEEVAQRYHFDGQLLEIRLLQACALFQQNAREQACAVLDFAVDLAERGKTLRPFIEAGPQLRPLFRQGYAADARRPFVQRLAALLDAPLSAAASPSSVAFDPEPSGFVRTLPPVTGTGVAVADALTRRELDILECLSRRLQNKEIAAQLFISTHTVNDHLKHVYQKLQVNGRREAVRKAVALGILASP